MATGIQKKTRDNAEQQVKEINSSSHVHLRRKLSETLPMFDLEYILLQIRCKVSR